MINPYAYFDCLALGTKLKRVFDSVAEAEFHVFTYLACLLSLYRSRPLADWEYGFVSTKNGSPFSTALADVVPELISSGMFVRASNNYLGITEDGSREYEFLRTLSQNQSREAFIDGASSSVLALPVGVVREAILQEPELHRATAVSSTRFLLDGPGIDILYDQFSVLSAAVGVEVQSLMVPSVVWLMYLAHYSNSLKPAFAEAMRPADVG